MLRNWTLFGVTTLLTFALTAPAQAGDKDGPQPEDRIKALETKLDTLIKSLAKSFADAREDALKIQEDLKGFKLDTQIKLQDAASRLEVLEKMVLRMKVDMDGAKNTKFYPPADNKELADLKNEIAQLRAALQQVVAKSSPVGPTTDKGSMVVINRYPESILLVINGAEQGRIAPNTQRVVQNLPAGTVTYEIISPTFGSTGVRSSTIEPNGTLRVNVSQ